MMIYRLFFIAILIFSPLISAQTSNFNIGSAIGGMVTISDGNSQCTPASLGLTANSGQIYSCAANGAGKLANVSYGANGDALVLYGQLIQPLNKKWAMNGLKADYNYALLFIADDFLSENPWLEAVRGSGLNVQTLKLLQVAGDGNVVIGTGADDGSNKLQINGSVKSTSALTIPGLKVSSAGRAVNIGTTADTLAASKYTTFESANTASSAFTVTIAAPTSDGEIRRICFKNITGTITWTVTAPATATNGLPATMTAGQCTAMIYNQTAGTPTNSAATTWYVY